MPAPKSDYGILLNKDIKLHRLYFKQMVKLLGINCIYKAPRKNKDYNVNGDLEASYYNPIIVGAIFESHPDIKTLKKAGWVTELQEGSCILHVPYDLPHLEVGAQFIVPSGIDNSKGRLFRVVSLSTTMIYPASIACEIAPEYRTITQDSELKEFTNSNFNILLDNEEDD